MSTADAVASLVLTLSNYVGTAAMALLATWLVHESVLRPRLAGYRALGRFHGFWRAHPQQFLGSYLVMWFGWWGVFLVVAELVFPASATSPALVAILVSAGINLAMTGALVVVGYLLLIQGASKMPLAPAPSAKA